MAALRREMAILRYDLSGKDWLTVGEASHYCGVSESNFRKHATDYGLEPRRFMGKQLYEKAAVYRSISDAKEWAPRRLTGPASETTSPEMAAAVAKLARYEKRRGRP